jgi:tRNA A37 N6-isopentenylltransferase MiaA
MLVEVTSVQKGCKVLINLEDVVEVAPLVSGGCVLYFNALEAGVTKTMTVTESYALFKQFAMQTVTAESIEKRFPKKAAPVATTIKPQEEGKGVEFSGKTYGEG